MAFFRSKDIVETEVTNIKFVKYLAKFEILKDHIKKYDFEDGYL